MDDLIRKLLIFSLPWPWNSSRPILDYPAQFSIDISPTRIIILMENSGPADPCVPQSCAQNLVWTQTELTLIYRCECPGPGVELYDDPSYLDVELRFIINGIPVYYRSTLITNYWFFIRRIEGWNLSLCCDKQPPIPDAVRRYCDDGEIKSALFTPNLIKTTIKNFISSKGIVPTGDLNQFELFLTESGACDNFIPCDDGLLSVKLFIDNQLVSEQIYPSISSQTIYTFVTSDATISDLGLDPSDITSFTLIRYLNSGNIQSIEINRLTFDPCGTNWIIKVENCPNLCSGGSGWYLSPGITIPGFDSTIRLAPPSGLVTQLALATIVALIAGGSVTITQEGTPILSVSNSVIVLSFVLCPGEFDIVNEFYN